MTVPDAKQPQLGSILDPLSATVRAMMNVITNMKCPKDLMGKSERKTTEKNQNQGQIQDFLGGGNS